MKKKNKLLFILSALLLLSCQKESSRKIRLAESGNSDFIRERVATLQIRAAERKSIAVFHFINETKNRELDWLEQGIMEMLLTDLGESRQLAVVPSAQIAESFRQLGLPGENSRDPQVLAAVGRKVHADALICGRYFSRNDSLFIALQMVDGKDGSLLASMQVGGEGLGHVFTMVDKLTRDLRDQLQVTLQKDRDQGKKSADPFTWSIDAYKKYSQGLEFIQKAYLPDALSSFAQAIELDSTFALAYLHLASTQYLMGSLPVARRTIGHAQAWREKLPENEQISLDAFQATIQGDFLRVVQLNKRQVELYPQDADAHINLSAFYEILQQQDKALKHAEIAAFLKPQDKVTYNRLGYLYSAIGKFDYAVQAMKKYIDLAPDEPNPYDSMGDIYLAEAQIDPAIHFYRLALKKNPEFLPSMYHLAWAYLASGDLEKADALIQEVMRKSESLQDSVQALALSAEFFAASGAHEKAVDVLYKGFENTQDLTVLYLLNAFDPQRVRQSDTLAEWLRRTAAHLQGESLGYERLFTLVTLCFETGTCLPQMHGLLQQLRSEKHGSLIAYFAAAFQMLLAMNDQDADAVAEIAKGLEPLDEQAPVISWSSYWKYYYALLEHLQAQGKSLDPYVPSAEDLKSIGLQNPALAVALTWSRVDWLLARDERTAADNLLASIGAPAENRWWLSRLFPLTDGYLQSFKPEQVAVSKLATQFGNNPEWQVADDGVSDGFIQLNALPSHAGNQAIYAVLPVYSKKAVNVQIRLGARRFFVLWLNNDKVISKINRRPAATDQYVVSARLNSGMNWLMIKLVAQPLAEGFYLRLTDESGKGLSGIEFAPVRGAVASR